MPCEMCGTEAAPFLAEIEGVKLSVCKECAMFGRVVGQARPPASVSPPRALRAGQAESPIAPPQAPEEPEFVVVSSYAKRIRDKREARGLKQEELAKRMAEKESLLHKIETGAFTPSIDLARKIEKLLDIHLVEKAEAVDAEVKSQKRGALTLGDIIKVRKK